MEDTDTLRSIGGSCLDGRATPPSTYIRGRLCREPGCGVVLSIYNPDSHCAEHEPKRLLRLVGKKAS
jgi:hypothetical protein